MREVLFKAKSKDNGEWVEGYYAKLNWGARDLHVIIPENTEMYSGNVVDIMIEIDPDTICAVKNDGWIPAEERLPDESDGLVLIQVNGKPKGNITLYNALELACYIAEGNEGWILEEYPEWENPDVIAWRLLPEPYRPEQEAAQRPEWKDRMLHTFLGGHV